MQPSKIRPNVNITKKKTIMQTSKVKHIIVKIQFLLCRYHPDSGAEASPVCLRHSGTPFHRLRRLHDGRQREAVREAGVASGHVAAVPAGTSREQDAGCVGEDVPGLRGAVLSQSLPRLANTLPARSPRRGSRKVMEEENGGSYGVGDGTRVVV